MSAVASLVSLVWLFGFGHGTLDPMGRPLGTDYSQVWAAGKMALGGHPADVWSWPKHFAVQQQIHHSTTVDLYGWHYPPPFLLVASLLALLPYLPALLVWQAASLGAFAALMRRLVPRWETVLLVVAAPVTLICVTHGHNGFLTAFLLGGGLLLLERKPLAAGLLLGCLIYKPQLALVIPPLLLVTRNWRAIAGACLSAGLLVAATLLFWGWPVWQAFLDSLPLTRDVVLEQGRTGWYKIMSPFSAVRMWGGSIALAYAVQSLVTAAAVAGALFLALRDNARLRNAAVTAAVVLSTPYVLDYDFVVLGLGLAWLWRDGEEKGFLPWDRSLMALVWIAPLAARRIAEFTYFPLGLIIAAIMLALPLRRSIVRASPFRRSREAFAQ
nr:glycosyltransferase family 87 protein [Sphingomonas anseongensis]